MRRDLGLTAGRMFEWKFTQATGKLYVQFCLLLSRNQERSEEELHCRRNDLIPLSANVVDDAIAPRRPNPPDMRV